MMTGIQLDRKDLEVSFRATLEIHLLLSSCMMLQVCSLDFVLQLIIYLSPNYLSSPPPHPGSCAHVCGNIYLYKLYSKNDEVPYAVAYCLFA